MNEIRKQEMIKSRMLVCHNREIGIPMDLLVESYDEYFKEGEFKDEFVVTNLSEQMMNNGDLTESITVLLIALQRDPFSLVLNSFLREHLASLNGKFEELSVKNTGSDGLATAYEGLVELGQVSFYVHLFAAENYLLLGEREKAKKIIENLNKVAPHLEGLQFLRGQL